MICWRCNQPMRIIGIKNAFGMPWSIFECPCGQEWERLVPVIRNHARDVEPLSPSASADARSAGSVNDAGNWWLWPVLVVSMGLLVIGAFHRIIGG